MLPSIFTVQVLLEALSALFFETFVTNNWTKRVNFTLEQVIKPRSGIETEPL
jgi:hypothetical protein